MTKYLIPTVLAIIASVIVAVQPVPIIKAQCPYSAEAQSTGKITCGPGGQYTLTPNPATGIPGIFCTGHPGYRAIQTALSGPHARLLQTNAC